MFHFTDPIEIICSALIAGISPIIVGHSHVKLVVVVGRPLRIRDRANRTGGHFSLFLLPCFRPVGQCRED